MTKNPKPQRNATVPPKAKKPVCKLSKKSPRKARPAAAAVVAPVAKPVVKPHQWTDDGDRVLILRRLNTNGVSHGGFAQWGKPEELNNVVRPMNWNPEAACGDGLHGWPWGMGLGEGQDYSLRDNRWLIIAAKPEDVTGELGGGLKCKCREVVKIFDGTFAGAWALINGGRHRLIEAMAAGNGNIASGTSSAASSSGYSSAASSSGYRSAASSSGDRSAASSSGTSSAASSSGDSSAASSSGTSSAASSSGTSSAASSSGDRSAASSSGDRSAASSSGYSSAASSSGTRSKSASVGDYSSSHNKGTGGIATAVGDCGEVMAGELGCIVAFWWNDAEKRYRAVVGYIGWNGIVANTRYRLNAKHEFEAVR
jgi:hypothetical protein